MSQVPSSRTGSKPNKSNKMNQSPSSDVESGITRKNSSISFQTPSRKNEPSYQGDVSPADTFDTVLTDGTTFDSSSPSRSTSGVSPLPTPQKLIIGHNVHTTSSTVDTNGGRGGYGKRGPLSSRAATSLIFGVSKPLLAVGLLAILGAGGAAAWGWLQIPGLQNQVKALEEQVMRLNVEIDRLSGEVDRLEDENDRYENLNDQLNTTVVELEDISDDLNETVLELENIVVDLNMTNQELSKQVALLESQNEDYAALNKDLNNTVTELTSQVDYFKVALADLAYENGILSNMTSALEVLTEQLTNTSVSQNETLIALQDFLQDMMAQNDRLEKFNRDLLVLVDFLNETSAGLGNSLEDITEFLSNQISVNQGLVLENLENTYRQRVQNWDCEYRDVFREEDFGNDFSIPIAETSQLSSVLEYVDQRVLSELCLDVDNFDTFLGSTYPDGVTSFRLVTAVLLYTDLAFDYFFPELGEVGIPLQGWVDASFKCEQLDSNFIWTTASRFRQ